METVTPHSPQPAASPAGAHFLTTHWEMVQAAGERSGEALEKLCRAYWAPLYAFVRRQGHDRHTAQDLTQEFFARMLAGSGVAGADPRRGRFRSFLLGAMKHFLANEWHRSQAQKRGGGCVIFSIEAAAEEDGFDPADGVAPDKIFERRWAETLLARVNARLRSEYEAAGWAGRFDALKIFLVGEGESYAATAEKLALSESAVKSAIYKLRQRFGQVLRNEIAQTVGSQEEVEDEIAFLLRALGE